MTRLLTLALTSLTSFLLLACGSSDVGTNGGLVGGACATDRDCESRCQTGGSFPGGTCTVSCRVDDDCPGGTFCIDTEGGICLLACELPRDCRAGYTCKGRPNRGRPGESLVCSD